MIVTKLMRKTVFQNTRNNFQTAMNLQERNSNLRKAMVGIYLHL